MKTKQEQLDLAAENSAVLVAMLRDVQADADPVLEIPAYDLLMEAVALRDRVKKLAQAHKISDLNK